MKVAIHQPNFCPYPGFFHKMMSSDIFVLMDDVQLEFDITNRNKIITKDGDWTRITIPIKKNQKFLPIMNVEIDNEKNWKELFCSKLLVYKETKNFDYYNEFFDEILKKEWKFLFDLNFEIIKKIMDWLDIKVRIIKESELKIKRTSNERLIDVCKKLDADTYISGLGAKEYINEKLFSENKINLEYQNFKPLVYHQMFSKEFLPNLSILDVMINVGNNNTRKLIEKSL